MGFANLTNLRLGIKPLFQCYAILLFLLMVIVRMSLLNDLAKYNYKCSLDA